MARTAPRAPRLLSAALLLLLLVPATRRAAGAPVVTELRCQCLQTVQGIHPKNIQSVKVTQSGPHCAHTEVIATLKNGHEACLNPEAPMVKRIIEKMLSNSN
ncbi:growth-regulated protein homolog gamma-like [Prionailurus bengalensis]|uniref:growth-regulated protein homolog gamma-like n=1 Tax=Prionailurus bengalensis TaxID=37029 RepID=UPI001CA9EA07|nr:growth-regulated protein homolog gamma-like [Prionailurus bengalensis]